MRVFLGPSECFVDDLESVFYNGRVWGAMESNRGAQCCVRQEKMIVMMNDTVATIIHFYIKFEILKI